MPLGCRMSSLQAVVVDYDGTCTDKDSIGTLLAAAAAAQCASPYKDRKQLDETIARLAANYVAKHKELLRQILPAEGSGVHNREGLDTFLEQLSDFDTKMNNVVTEAGILAGLSSQHLKDAAKAAKLRPGCLHALQQISSLQVPIHVISVNWSSRFVAAGLEPLDLEPSSMEAISSLTQKGILPSSSPSGFVFANELVSGVDGVSTGALMGGVQNARDKAALLQGLLQHYRAQGSPHAGNMVFIGDSVSDLKALLTAPYGIILGQDQLIRRVCACYGIPVQPLHSIAQHPPGAGQVLYEASNWTEIQEFLLQRFAGTHGPKLQHQQVPRVLSIAGSDSGGGAGVQADLKAIMACGVFGTCAVTALTAQNTLGVHSVHVPPLPFLAQQIDAVIGDMGASTVKTGMLPNSEIVELVANKMKEHQVAQLVVDPVLVSTSGHPLAEGSVAMALLRHLTPLATLITPNIPEASALLGGFPVNSVADMEAAAKALHTASGCQAVLIKGGHLVAEPSSHTAAPDSYEGHSTSVEGGSNRGGTASTTASSRRGANPAPGCSMVSRSPIPFVTDVFYDGQQLHRLVRTKVDTSNTHGTGCTLASAIAAELSKGRPLLDAVDAASQYLHAALWNSREIKIGEGPQRPFNHGWMLADWKQSRYPVYNAEGFAHQRAGADFVRQALRLYAVTDPDLNEKHGRSLYEAVTAALAGGATMIQVREKHASGSEFLAEVQSVLQACRAAGVPLIVNDRVDVALAAGPDVGVHVGQDDLPAAEVRRLLGPNRILGVTVKTVEEAVKAKQDGADYLGAGAVYASSTKDSGVIGLAGLAAVCEAATPVPVVAIGGIQTANALEPVKAGAVGVAVVSVLFGAPDIKDATNKLAEQLRQLLS